MAWYVLFGVIADVGNGTSIMDWNMNQYHSPKLPVCIVLRSNPLPIRQY